MRSRSSRADTSTPAYVIWTLGLKQQVSDEDDEDYVRKLGKDALAARAKARKAITTSDAAITLKFARADAASLEACVMPLIFEVNEVRHRGTGRATAASPRLTRASRAGLVRGAAGTSGCEDVARHSGAGQVRDGEPAAARRRRRQHGAWLALRAALLAR